MKSVIAEILDMKFSPVALTRTNERPAKALQFKEGKRACAMYLFACAAQGRTAVADASTCGCFGGISGFGFGNGYKNFPAGESGFCGFLSSGNGNTPQGRAIGEKIAARSPEFAQHYLEGERYKRGPELVKEWLGELPLVYDAPTYLTFRPLADVEPENGDIPDVVVFTVNAQQLSSLVVLANYGSPRSDRVIIPFGSGCQLIGILPFAEGASENPRAVVGLTDLSAREKTLRSLGRDQLTFAMPWKLFLEMESEAPNSFLSMPTFLRLTGKM